MLAWMPAAHAKAAGRFDEALGRYSEFLTEAEEGRVGVWGAALPWTWAEASNAFASVADWEGFEAYLARLKVRLAPQLPQEASPILHWTRRSFPNQSECMFKRFHNKTVAIQVKGH